MLIRLQIGPLKVDNADGWRRPYLRWNGLHLDPNIHYYFSTRNYVMTVHFLWFRLMWIRNGATGDVR